MTKDIHDFGDKVHDKWSKEEYEQAATIAEEKGAGKYEMDEMEDESDDGSMVDEDSSDEMEDGGDVDANVELFGIKHHCPLNSLQSFHSLTGFPLDILHDIFEGVISEDLLGIIRILSAKNWFSIEEYNKSLLGLNYKSHEASDKPLAVPILNKTRKLNGKACSIWVHMRNFPIAIRSFVKDKEDSALDLGLKLHEITERLTSGGFEEYEIDTLEELIVDYLDERKSLHGEHPGLLGTPKPKTHYLSHYPMAIRLYGPPMSYWTARYESRHRIAKNTAEASKNFKNISLTVSTRQQMRLSSVYYHGMFATTDLLILSKTSYKKSLVEDTSLQSVLPFMSDTDFLCSVVEFRSQVYKSGDLVVLEISGQDEIKVGLIVSILVRKESVLLVTREFSATRNYLHFFQAQSDELTMTLNKADQLVDYKPLLNHGTPSQVFFCLHHHISFSHP